MYEVKLKGSGVVSSSEPYSLAGEDDVLTFAAERYEVRRLYYYVPGECITVLVSKPRATGRQILGALIDGYRRRP
jgi:hypothetical protein